MNKKSKWILIAVIFLVVILAALAKWGVFGREEGVKVTVDAAARQTITEVVSATGRVYPEVEVKVSPDISGEITDLTVQEGDTVKKGQLLARIYADIYDIQRSQAASGVAQSRAQVANSQANLEALKAQMDQAEKTFLMQKQLFRDKVISQNEFNTAESAFKTAKANYDAARQSIRAGQAGVQTAIASLQRADKDLSRTTVLAPMSGVVSLLNVKRGERVVGSNLMAGTEMLRIADMSKIEIRVDVGENDIPKVKLGDSALIEVDAYGTRKFRGLVTQIASSNTGAASQSAAAALTDVTQYKVYIRILPESYADLSAKGRMPFRPGMTASADIQTQTRKNVLSVPINAVTTRDKTEKQAMKKAKEKKDDDTREEITTMEDLDVVVFVVGKDKKVKKVIVKTGIQDLNNIEILEGLDDGAEVVSGPYEVVSKTLKEGLQVIKTEKENLFKED